MAPRRILLVEDEADIRDSLKDLLEASVEGIEVHAAPGGAEALEALASFAPHLVLSDYKMPGMNGLELLHAVRERAPGAHRLLMTAFPDLDVALGAINGAHIHGYLPKPLDVDGLLDRIRSAFELQEAKRRGEQAMARAVRGG